MAAVTECDGATAGGVEAKLKQCGWQRGSDNDAWWQCWDLTRQIQGSPSSWALPDLQLQGSGRRSQPLGGVPSVLQAARARRLARQSSRRAGRKAQALTT